MAAAASVTLNVNVTGLGAANYSLSKMFSGTTPTVVTQAHRLLAANTSEAVPLGDIATVEGAIIIAVTEAMEVDLDFVSSFDADGAVAEGEAQYFKPSGTLHIKNTHGSNAGAYEYLLFGTA